MKKLLLFSILTSITATVSFAQKDASAKAILSKVSEKYRSYEVLKTDFDLTIDNQQAGEKITQSGTLIAKPKVNKFRVSMYAQGTASKPVIEQEIISDGKTQWTYLKKDNEVQINNADNSEEGFNPAKIFTMYEHGYKYIYNGEIKAAVGICQEIDLTPEDIQKPFFKVRLLIDKAKKQIYSALIFDKNGSHYTYTLRNFTGNAPVTNNTFSFDVKEHKGVETVDLR
ncbi:MAG TPA: outer membrane lipoprotein carrier protein LolA [Mucilaginibacter sp.]|jgi:outer membrane lipoprotein-sorting protein